MPETVGSKLMVYKGQATRTQGGHRKKDLMVNKRNKVVSIKAHKAGQDAFARNGLTAKSPRQMRKMRKMRNQIQPRKPSPRKRKRKSSPRKRKRKSSPKCKPWHEDLCDTGKCSNGKKCSDKRRCVSPKGPVWIRSGCKDIDSVKKRREDARKYKDEIKFDRVADSREWFKEKRTVFPPHLWSKLT